MSPEKKEYKALFFGFNRFEQARIHKLFSRVRPDVLLLSASTKQKAHALLKQELISVVFIQTSAKKNGFAFLQDINTGETRIPTVLVTDPRDAGAALKAFERGAYECLPCEKNVIRHFPAALDRALARHHYRKFANAQEWAIIQSRREWITIIDAITDYIFITDDQCKLVKMNLAFSSEFGSAHPRSLIGSTCVGIFGDDTPCTNCRKKSEGTVFDTVDKRLNDNVYQHSTFPLSIDEKSFSVHVMKNITEMRKLKDRLYSSDKLASLGSLVAGVAHEINNPLTGIIAYAELLRMNPLADKVDAELKKILHNAERCKKIVENLLTFSRQKAPAKSIESLNDILDRTIELRTYWHRAGNIEIVREYGESLAVFVDSQQMQLVVMNIL
ncbi:MAG: histidine kinase dimerization/phospho-acceptor domain-containing protein, partial [Nitrospirota bacterium]